jgi:cobalamin biosynthesis protein CobD/CbiB
MFILRRLLSVGCIILLSALPLMAKVPIYCLIQLVFLVYTIKVRPFEDIKDNIIEILNDSGYFVF